MVIYEARAGMYHVLLAIVGHNPRLWAKAATEKRDKITRDSVRNMSFCPALRRARRLSFFFYSTPSLLRGAVNDKSVTKYNTVLKTCKMALKVASF